MILLDTVVEAPAHQDRLQFTPRALLQPSLRIAGNDGGTPFCASANRADRPRPGEGDWRRTVATAYSLAASAAFDLAADLARVLQATAPKLRALVMAKPKTSTPLDASLLSCRRPCAGGNGWAGSKRQSSSHQNRWGAKIWTFKARQTSQILPRRANSIFPFRSSTNVVERCLIFSVTS